MRYLYLHGFASSPRSRKSQAFRAALAAQGIELEIPQLDEGDFEHLTLTGQLSVIERTLQGQPARLAGSSMGGYLAALYASAHPEVNRVVLMAPAFSFSQRWGDVFGQKQAGAWRESGWLKVFHYSEMTLRRVHYRLYEDALRYPEAPGFSQPAVLFHGTEDKVVPIALSRAYAALHPNVRLTEVDSDHELLSVLPEVTATAVGFLTGDGVTQEKQAGSAPAPVRSSIVPSCREII
jgi:pimeloyl-ACP methyl ester carboxylesterase